MSLYAMALQDGQRSPVAGCMRASSSLSRLSSASIRSGAVCSRFQVGMRSSALMTSSSIPMGLPFEECGLVNLHRSQTGNPTFVFHPRRRTQLARLFDSLLSLQTAVRGQVHGFGRAGAARCFSSF